MRSPSLWLYLLAAVTVLTIALRRVLSRVTPLNDEVYAKKVAIDHVHSGVCWVRADGMIGTVNPAMAKILGGTERDLIGIAWTKMFPSGSHEKVDEVYRQALLMGKAPVEIEAQRFDGTKATVDVLLVTVHDHKSRFIGHYCLMEDRSRVIELEDQVQRLIAMVEAPGEAVGK